MNLNNILIVASSYHLNLYKVGFDDYAKKNGINIKYIYLDNDDKRRISPLTKGRKSSFQLNTLAKNFKDIATECDSILFINLSSTTQYLIKENYELCRGKSIIMFVDTMRDCKNFKDWSVFSKIYSFEDSDIEYAKSMYNIAVRYTPIGTTYHLYNTVDDGYKYDISFVCLASKKRLQYLDAIAKYCIKNNKKMFLAGHFWHNNNIIQSFLGRIKFRIKYPCLYKFVKNNRLKPSELAQIYKDSKILLNINIAKHNSFNERNFDIMISNRLLITDNESLNGVDILPGKEFIMSTGIEDMVRCIDYYLKNETERLSIAKAGMIKTENKYLFSNSLDTIFKE